MRIRRLAHAYAVTVHRAQGSTVARAHALEHGGGRELAYVKMSRARERSTVYAVAETVAQATEDLARDWSVPRRPAWVIDSATPATDPAAVEADPRVAESMRAALRRGRLQAERHAIAAAIPPGPTAEIRAVERDRDRLQRQQDDLQAGTDGYARQPIGAAVRDLAQAESNLTRIEASLRNHKPSRADRRRRRPRSMIGSSVGQRHAGRWKPWPVPSSVACTASTDSSASASQGCGASARSARSGLIAIPRPPVVLTASPPTSPPWTPKSIRPVPCRAAKSAGSATSPGSGRRRRRPLGLWSVISASTCDA